MPGISECYKIIEKWDTPSMNLKFNGTEIFTQYDLHSKEWLDNWYQKDICVNNVLAGTMSRILGWGNPA